MDQNDNNNFWDQPIPTGQPIQDPQPTVQQPTSAPTQPASISTDQSSDEEINNLTDQEVIDLFIRGIMQEKGTNVGDEETQNKIFDELKNELLKQIDRSLIAELPDDKLEEFNQIATEKGQIDPNMIIQAVIDANVDASKITAITMQKFREVYLNNREVAEGAR